VEETDGKTFRSNGSLSMDVRIALVAGPSASEVMNRNEGTLEVPKVISTCSYVFVDSTKSLAAGYAWRQPISPGRRNELRKTPLSSP
jgi:hypothetical protein